MKPQQPPSPAPHCTPPDYTALSVGAHLPTSRDQGPGQAALGSLGSLGPFGLSRTEPSMGWGDAGGTGRYLGHWKCSFSAARDHGSERTHKPPKSSVCFYCETWFLPTDPGGSPWLEPTGDGRRERKGESAVRRKERRVTLAPGESSSCHPDCRGRGRLSTLFSCPCPPASPLLSLMVPPVGNTCPEGQPAGE